MERKEKQECNEGTVIFPYHTRAMMKFLEGEEIRVFAHLMRKMVPLTNELIYSYRYQCPINWEDFVGDNGKVQVRMALSELGNTPNHYKRTIDGIEGVGCLVWGNEDVMAITYSTSGKSKVAIF